MPSYILYSKPTCPFCRKVLRHMDALGIDIPIRDTRDSKTREELVQIGGMGQVPCLVIDGTALYESDDIVAYLTDAREKGLL